MLPQPVFTPLAASWLKDPQPHFAILRACAPLYRSDELNCWVVSRHADVRRVLTDHRAFAADPRRAGCGLPVGTDSVQVLDPPGNIALRRVLAGLLGDGARRTDPGQLRQLARRELARLRAGGDDLTVATTGFSLAATCGVLAMPVPPQEWLYPRSEAIVTAMDAGFRPQTLPAANRAKTQLSAMIESWLRAEAASWPLLDPPESSAGLINSIRVIFHAGYTSLSRFLENASVLLLTDPALRARYLRLGPDRRREAAIPELLRWTSTVQATSRLAVSSQLMHGEQISAGQPVIALIASANWDGEVFARPELVDFDRDCAAALGMGAGTHSCLGKEFAASCAEIFLTELLADSSWRITGAGRRRDTATLRGWQEIPIGCCPASEYRSA
jgi:cytochrome P450